MLFLAYAMEFETAIEYQGWAVQQSAGFLSLKFTGESYVKYKYESYQCLAYGE